MEGIKQEKLIIDGLNESISIQDVIDHFKDCGPIKEAFIFKSHNSYSAEIVFKDESSLFKALNKNATQINDSTINLHINSQNNNKINSNAHNYNTKSNNNFINLKENNNEESNLSNSLNINDSSLDLEKKSLEENENENSNNEGIKKNKRTDENLDELSDIDFNDSESEDDISDNEGYNNFMKEYKQYCKSTKKAINKQVDGEINVQNLLIKANNFYLNNNYSEAKEVLETIISVSPNLQEPYLILSQIYEDEKNEEKRIKELMRI